ncbi:phage baseplate upper protein [Enterococcus sp. LJL51]|uniref:phage baseplate upper protein n=1 Tax=Enterococcus sp. LJL51 TaxID=3416656 RepID=UPI003CE6F3B9
MTITYPVFLSITQPNDNIPTIVIRQFDEGTQTLEVTVTEKGQPKDITGFTPFFCVKQGHHSGLGISEQRVTQIIDAKNGKLRYTLTNYDMQNIGENTAYFAFRTLKEDNTWQQQFSTRDFHYQVKKSIFGDGIKDSNYIWTFEEILRYFREWLSKSKEDFVEWNEEAKREILMIIKEFQKWINENQKEYEDWLENSKISWTDWVESIREILESIDPGGAILTELTDARGSFPRLKNRLDNQDEKIKSKRNKNEPKAGLVLNNKFRYQHSTNGYCVPQGFCSTENSFLIVYNDHYTDGRTESEMCLLQEISFENGEILREKEIELGHGNGLTYREDTNEVLCVAGFMLGNENKEVIVIDYDTLTIKKTYPTSLNLTAISYDKSSKRLWAKSNKTICELNLNDYSILKRFEIETDSIGQDICAQNNYIYLPLSNPESMMVVDDMGNLIQNYKVPRYSGDNTYINELEGVAHVKGNQFALISFNFSSLSKKSSDINIFLFDVISSQQILRRTFSNYPNARIDYHVDCNYTGFDSDGTKEKPYKNLNQCFNACANAAYMYTIYMAEGEYPFAELSMVQTLIEIQGNGATIHGLAFNRVSKLSLNNLILTNKESSHALTLDNISTAKLIGIESKMKVGTKCFRFFDSSVSMEKCTILGDGVTSSNTQIYEVGSTVNTDTAFSISNRSSLNFSHTSLQDKIVVGNGVAKLATYPPTVVFNRSDANKKFFGYAKINRMIFNDFLLTFNIGTTFMSQEKINTRDINTLVRFIEVANTTGDLIAYELRLVQVYDDKQLLKDIQITESRKTTFKSDGSRSYTNWNTSSSYPEDLPHIETIRVFS